MSHNQQSYLKQSIVSLEAERYRNVSQLGFSLKYALDCEDFYMSKILREISQNIDRHLKSWTMECEFQVISDTDDEFKIVCNKAGEEKFTISVPYEKNTGVSPTAH